MPCCCACKSPVGLIGIAHVAPSVENCSRLTGPGDKKPEAPAQPGAAKPAETTIDPYVLGFKMNRIDGAPEDLSTYKGKVVLIVNVASKCGYTKQYSGLEKLYEDKKDQGFVILGFPANNFGEQEPGTNTEIKQFCTSKFNVTFPMCREDRREGATRPRRCTKSWPHSPRRSEASRSGTSPSSWWIATATSWPDSSQRPRRTTSRSRKKSTSCSKPRRARRRRAPRRSASAVSSEIELACERPGTPERAVSGEGSLWCA